MSYTWSRQSVGRPKTINDAYLERLKELVSHSPRHFGYPFERWTARWLRDHLAKEFELEISDRHVNRLLQQMGLSARQRRSQFNAAVKHLSGQSVGMALSD